MANEFKIKKGLIVEGASGGVVVNVLGSQGQLLSVTDDLSGSIFAVSDISGVPIFDVNSSGVSYFDGTVEIGTLTGSSVNSQANQLWLKSTENNGITISSGNSKTGTIFFGDVANAAAGGFRYNHNTGDMAISAEDNITFACDKVGIGTTSPGGIFEVFQQSTGRTRGDLLVDAGAKYVYVGRLSTTSGDVSSFKVRDRLNRAYFDVNTASKYISFNPEVGDITMQIASGYGFKVNGSQFNVNASSGKVGIGTSGPGTALQVGGLDDGSNYDITVGWNAVSSQAVGTKRSALTFKTSQTGVNNEDIYKWDIAMVTAPATASSEPFGSDLAFLRSTRSSTSVNETTMILTQLGSVGIGTATPNYKLTVSGGINAGGVVTYNKVAGSLDTTGYAVAGLTAGFNGASAGFEFKCYGSASKYQRIVYSCHCSGTTWVPGKVIDEGTNDLDVVASANGATITFTFKARSSTQHYSPRVVVQATGHSINSTYA